MKIKEAMKVLEEQGFDILESKAVLRLNDGAVEVYFDHDEDTLKTELHGKTVYVFNGLLDRSVESVMFELAGVDEEDE